MTTMAEVSSRASTCGAITFFQWFYHALALPRKEFGQNA